MYGEQAVFLCDDGYRLRGSDKRKCYSPLGTDIGRWSGFTPYCERECNRTLFTMNDEKHIAQKVLKIKWEIILWWHQTFQTLICDVTGPANNRGFHDKQIHWRIYGAGGEGGTRDAPLLGPISFIFMQFSGKIWPGNRLAPPLELAPTSGKSWIRHWNMSGLWYLTDIKCNFLVISIIQVLQW